MSVKESVCVCLCLRGRQKRVGGGYQSVCIFNHTLTCRPQYHLCSKMCLPSFLSPCGHCICVIYRVKPRQSSGAFLELICLTVVHVLYMCARVSEIQRKRVDVQRGKKEPASHTYGTSVGDCLIMSAECTLPRA